MLTDTDSTQKGKKIGFDEVIECDSDWATMMETAINKLKDQGYFVYSAEADGTLYNKVNYADKVCLVIGSEGNGLSRLGRDNSDEIISIPMCGKVNSLNASVAAGILIYGIGE